MHASILEGLQAGKSEDIIYIAVILVLSVD